MGMTAHEVGTYIRLLCYQWGTGKLSSDPATQEIIAGGKVSEAVLAKFPRGKNRRLEQERRKQQEYRKKQRNNGMLGGRPAKPKPNPSLSSGLTQTEPKKTSAFLEGDANSKRQTADPTKKEEMSPPPLDAWLVQLQEDYPEQRVTYGFMTSSAFFEAFRKDPRPAAEVWAEMRSNLENQKAGHEWRVKRMAPKLEKWLADGLWRQRHDADAPSESPAKPTKYANWRPR